MFLGPHPHCISLLTLYKTIKKLFPYEKTARKPVFGYLSCRSFQHEGHREDAILCSVFMNYAELLCIFFRRTCYSNVRDHDKMVNNESSATHNCFNNFIYPMFWSQKSVQRNIYILNTIQCRLVLDIQY
jgi:hypothetical protein